MELLRQGNRFIASASIPQSPSLVARDICPTAISAMAGNDEWGERLATTPQFCLEIWFGEEWADGEWSYFLTLALMLHRWFTRNGTLRTALVK